MVLNAARAVRLLRKAGMDPRRLVTEPELFDEACRILARSVPVPLRRSIGEDRIVAVVRTVRDEAATRYRTDGLRVTVRAQAEAGQGVDGPSSASAEQDLSEVAVASAPGAFGVLVVIPFVNEGDPDDRRTLLGEAHELIAFLASGNPFELVAHVLDDRAAVAEIATHLRMSTLMAEHGLFVVIPIADPDDPDNVAGVQRNASRLVDLLGKLPSFVVDRPDLVGLVAETLTATNA